MTMRRDRRWYARVTMMFLLALAVVGTGLLTGWWQLAAILLVYGTALSVELAALTNCIQMLPEARATGVPRCRSPGTSGPPPSPRCWCCTRTPKSIGWAIAFPGMLLLGPAVAFALARDRFVRAG